MDTTVFDIFKEIPYEFLTIQQGTVYGNRVTDTASHTGVFKLRSNQGNTSSTIQLQQSSATLHAHPEDYDGINHAEIIGNGVNVNGVDYSIVNVTEGMNYDNGKLEHLTFTLEKAEYVR